MNEIQCKRTTLRQRVNELAFPEFKEITWSPGGFIENSRLSFTVQTHAFFLK